MKKSSGVSGNLDAHKRKKQPKGSTKRTAPKHQKGLNHGNNNSKKGNKPNPNQRHGAEKRGRGD